MSRWKSLKLEEILDFYNGKEVKPFQKGKFPVYGSNGIIGFYGDYNFENGIIIGRVGAYCGSVNINTSKFWSSDNTIVVQTKANNSIKYLYYMLQTMKLNNYAGGSAQPLLTQRVLKNLKIKIPNLKTQEKIADTLSTYDELIENNNKRIEILEKTAEEIYKEWFVRMRFPGHEDVKFEKGIPEGWEVRRVGDIIDKLESGKRPKDRYEEEKMVVSLGAGDVKNLGEYSDSDEYLIPYSFFRGLNRGVVESKDIAVYKDGAYTGKVTMFRDGFPYNEMAINEHVFLVRCKDKKLQNYLLFTLKQKSYYELIQALSMTSAQPGINQSKFKNIKIEIPNKELIDKFHDISELYLRKIFNLAKQNQNLIKQRDLLLPRLMNGTIKVK